MLPLRSWLAAAACLACLAAGCGGLPKEGDPCTGAIRTCGDNGVGLECQDLHFKAICMNCKPKPGVDDIECGAVQICIAPDAGPCGAH
jgi:hypothetical protein